MISHKRAGKLAAMLLVLVAYTVGTHAAPPGFPDDPPPPPPPSKPVTWIHGLAGSATAWQPIGGRLYTEYEISNNYIGYSSNSRITQIADAVSTQTTDNSLVIGHSMGGLVAREIVRKYGTAKVNKLITVGTPHYGSKMAEAAPFVEAMAYDWGNALFFGPATSLDLFGTPELTPLTYDDTYRYVNDLIGILVGMVIDNYVADNYISVVDLKTTSGFISTLNSNPSSTMPSITKAIFGAEYPPEMVRLADAAWNDGVETGEWASFHYKLLVIYNNIALGYEYAAQYAWSNYQMGGKAEDYYWYVAFTTAADAWWYGVDYLYVGMQWEWDRNVTGAALEDGTWWTSDGVVPSYSQVFNSEIPSSEYIRMDGINHLEEVEILDETLGALRTAFENQDVGVSRR